MYTIHANNVNEALVYGLRYLQRWGYTEDSRNGTVIRSPWPVTTHYTYPEQKVVFWAQRDANPFFHIYEALWMLAGRNDVQGPSKYVKTFSQYSDDGEIFHGAYGFRWRQHFVRWTEDHSSGETVDQLEIIIRRLKENPRDRRCVLAMHDAAMDLDADTKDQPCNLTATFQINLDNELDLVVFCRSNDIIWGCYGANAVHFGFLLEYMAHRIGVPVGSYHQISVNWHAYIDVYKKTLPLIHEQPESYQGMCKKNVPIVGEPGQIDEEILYILDRADAEKMYVSRNDMKLSRWGDHLYNVLMAHELYRMGKDKNSIREGLEVLRQNTTDWGAAGTMWLSRRLSKICLKEFSNA